jgi:hypothetical protein
MTGLSYDDINWHQFTFATQNVPNVKIGDDYSVPAMQMHVDTLIDLESLEPETRFLLLWANRRSFTALSQVTFVCQNFPCHNGLNQQKGPSMRMAIEIALSLLVILGLVVLYRHTHPPTGKK